MLSKKSKKHCFVILAYKESPYLEDCVKSVVGQKKKSEVIIFTTTPNSYIEKIAKKYKLKIMTGVHASIGDDFDSAIEAGRKYCGCKIVTIAHQDDVYDNGYAKAVREAFRKTKDAQILFTDYYEIKDSGKEYSNTNLRIKRILLAPLRFKVLQKTRFAKSMALRFGDAISCPAVTFNLEKIKTPLFASKFRCDVDWHAWEILLKEKGAFVFIPRKLMGHRIHGGSETTKTIEDDRRTSEDYEILCRFWPKCIAGMIARLYKNSEKNNKQNKDLENRKTQSISARRRLLLAKSFYLWLSLMVLNLVICWQVFQKDEKSIFCIGYFFLLIVGLATLLWCSRGGVKAEKVFLACIIPLGIMFILAMPCGESPDDVTHFYRIYGISEGVIDVPIEGDEADGSYFPVKSFFSFSTVPKEGNYEIVKRKIFEKASAETEFVEYRGSASYNPVAYIPQVIGVFAGKIFGSILIEAYAARIMNLCLYILLTYFAIKIIPKYKTFLIFLALLPISVQEATSLSIDALTISLSFFLVAIAFYHIDKKHSKMTKKELFVLYSTALMIGVCKQVYLPLLALYVCVPKARFGGKKKKNIHAVIMISMVVILNLALFYLSRRHAAVELEGVDGGRQISLLMHNPLVLAKAIIKTLCYNLLFYVESGLGIYLGPFAIKLPKIYTIIIVVFAAIILIDSSEKIFKKWSDVLLGLLAFSMPIIGVFLALFISWTPVGHLVIGGVQGRYFIPVALLLPAMVGTLKTRKCNKINALDVAAMMYGMNACAILYVVANNL